MALRRTALEIVAPLAAGLVLAAAGFALAALAPAAASAAASTIYVASTAEYNATFKAEEGRLYVVELEGATHCYETEPFEDLGSGGFNVFAAPTLLQDLGEGPVAEGDAGGRGLGGARVKASLGGDEVTGTFSYATSEESFHCATGQDSSFIAGEIPFAAKRYEPAGTPGTVAPPPTELPVFYANTGRAEVFLRTASHAVVGIRGTFAPTCPVGSKTGPSPRALFGKPLEAKLDADGHFRQRVVYTGGPRTAPAYREVATIAGQIEGGVVTGTFTRFRKTKPANQEARLCATGPLPFSAVRYLPVAGA
jgi:hypothetical protein